MPADYKATDKKLKIRSSSSSRSSSSNRSSRSSRSSRISRSSRSSRRGSRRLVVDRGVGVR